MAYSIQIIADIMSKLPAPTSSEDAIATYILDHLHGYRHNANGRSLDHEFIKTAIQAYAKLLQNHEVKVI